MKIKEAKGTLVNKYRCILFLWQNVQQHCFGFRGRRFDGYRHRAEVLTTWYLPEISEKINVNYTGHNAASLAAQLAQDPLDKDFMPMQFNEGFGHVERVRRWEDHLDDLSRSAREQAKKRKDNDEKKRKMEQELNNVEHQL